MSGFKVFGTTGEIASDALFGGNILAPRGVMTGEGSYSALVEDLGVSGLRYPGGSLTEEYFDIANPDAPLVTGNENGETTEFIPLSEFMSTAQSLEAGVTIVLPTRTQLSDATDTNGNRMADIDAPALRQFIQDVVTGVYGDARIDAFEIGNEYWGSGRMNSIEYGRVSSEMTRIIDDTLAGLDAGPMDGEIDILVQMGTNFGHASLDEAYDSAEPAAIVADLNARFGLELTEAELGHGRPDWAEISNKIIMRQFDEDTIDDVDGIVAHVYSKEQMIDGQRSFHLNVVDQTWGAAHDHLEVHVTEWNTSGNTSLLERGEDYGLYQAGEMLDIVEEFMRTGVDAAHAWPLMQNTANAFSLGDDHQALTPGGEMFALMSDSLPGKRMIDFDSDTRETEAEGENINLHGFLGEGELVFFVVSTAATTATSTIDLSTMITGWGDAEAVRLGVAEGAHAGDTAAPAVRETMDVDAMRDGTTFEVTLAPGEILRLTLSDISPTADFSAEQVSAGSGNGLIFDTAAAEDSGSDASSGVTIDGDTPPAGLVTDTVAGEPASPPTAPSGAFTAGTDASNWLSGDASDDKLKGYRGDDTLRGGGGDDTINGGRGDDALYGGADNDMIRGREDDDTLVGGTGDDTLFGESGSDHLRGAAGNDVLIGGSGDDWLDGGQNADWLDGGAGNNQIETGFGYDTIAFDNDNEYFSTRITDFTVGRDKLHFDLEVVGDASDLRVSGTDNALRILVGGDENREIILEGEFDADTFLEEDTLSFAA